MECSVALADASVWDSLDVSESSVDAESASQPGNPEVVIVIDDVHPEVETSADSLDEEKGDSQTLGAAGEAADQLDTTPQKRKASDSDLAPVWDINSFEYRVRLQGHTRPFESMSPKAAETALDKEAAFDEEFDKFFMVEIKKSCPDWYALKRKQLKALKGIVDTVHKVIFFQKNLQFGKM